MAKRKKKRTGKKYIIVLFLLVVIAAGYGGFFYYQKWLAPNTAKSGKLYVPTGADYKQVLDSIRPFLENEASFKWLAEQKKYPGHIKPGRYTIEKGEGNSSIINRLRIGEQDEISIRIGNYSSIFELAGKLGALLETDSAGLVKAMTEADFAKGYDTAALIFFYFPDTYNFHWNTSGPAFVKRMKQEYDKYWNPEKIQEAKSKNMTPLEVTTLASIVQLESAMVDEQPRVAGLYLNRLKIGMKLDADPTVIYALKKAENFKRKIQRVYYKNLSIESPYNTYKYKGLPPSPICMPNRSALDAVLKPAAHNYLYFVADPQKPGYHVYASTLKEQEENANKYRNWANENNVK
jgi:UPF0755 protein